jgi:hypothetical protein
MITSHGGVLKAPTLMELCVLVKSNSSCLQRALDLMLSPLVSLYLTKRHRSERSYLPSSEVAGKSGCGLGTRRLFDNNSLISRVVKRRINQKLIHNSQLIF